MNKQKASLFLWNEVSDFLQELVEGNLDSFNIMDKAEKLLKEINKGEQYEHS